MSETSKHQPKSPVDIGIAEPETAASSMDVPEGEAQSLVALSEDGISNSLDHALLESLFYNEMALMDDFSEFLYSSSSGMGGSSVGGTVAAGEATNPTHSANTSNHDSGSTNLVTQARTTNTPLDSSLAVETDLLRHFGIAHASPELNPIITATGAAAPPQLLTDNHHQHVTSTAPVNVMSHPPKVVASSTTAIETTPTKSPSFVPPPVDAHQQRLNLQAVAASGRRGIRHNVVVVVPPQNNSVVCAQTPSTAPQPLPIPSIATSCASLNNNSLLPKTETESLSNCPPPTANNNQNSDNNTIHNNNNNNELASDMEKRSKLVTQFATLAGRLGITLPPQVLHKLTTTTHAAATGPSSHVAQPPLLPPPPIASVAPDSAANAFAIANPNGSIIIESCAVLPTSTATDVATLTATSAAIVPTSVASFGTDSSPALATAQVSSSTVGLESSGVKRPAESSILDTNLPRSDSAVDLSSHNKGGGPYSKRRKKPRLSDCERRLAQLVAEQALLQSQCNAMANRKDALDAERIAAETHMRTILQQDAPAQELDAAVQNFTELYSDYGRKRHEELIFHLEQLQRLSNPTNFTKMGLWTLGGGGHDAHHDHSRSGNEIGSNDGITVANRGNVASSAVSESNISPIRSQDINISVHSPGSSNISSNTSSKDRSNPIAGMLQKELGISVTQGRKILDQRQKIQTVCSNLKECFLLMGKLNALCKQKTQIFHDRMTKCREILTPKQVVKLLLWIDENSQTLGSVCPGWVSEQFQSKSKPPT